jgi:hypothetical protein
MKTKTIMIMVTPEFKKRVWEAANKDNKSLTDYVRDCLLVDLENKDMNNAGKKP